ncbi:T9SS type A sorting domain-containing protein [Pedobacter sp. SD-b]|uniref:T9SS type A sorting domain-containing protein n=1 Tax=Pedobacter segetis TaxID=2793069 RepID=A0ABS1BIY3_9SPHI|nr:T9SS type A sorting domain-containing protein [Pedobacter segetis]MBK0382849.1 T9SS type A sorting domain-containing protein [Pedobacter segetis]
MLNFYNKKRLLLCTMVFSALASSASEKINDEKPKFHQTDKQKVDYFKARYQYPLLPNFEVFNGIDLSAKKIQQSSFVSKNQSVFLNRKSNTGISNAPTAFTAGNLLVVVVDPTSSGSSAITLNEYSTSGTVGAVHSIDNTQYSLATGNQGEGLGNLSQNGNYFSLGVYNAPAGTQNIASTTSSAYPRVILRLSADETLDTVQLTNTFNKGDIFGAVCDDNGTKFWAGGSTSSGGVAGLVFKEKGTTAAPVNITGNNLRSPQIFGGTLYISGNVGTIGSTDVVRLASFSTPLPETASSPINLNNSDLSKTIANGGVQVDIYQYVVADMDGTPGPDVVYVSNVNGSNTPGIKKYVLESGSWNYKYTIVNGTSQFRGLTGERSGSDVILYGVADGNKIIKVIDANALTNLTTAPTPSVLVTASSTQQFRGISFTPGSPSTLPLTLESFGAKVRDHFNQLSWQTASEVNSSHFVVEKSIDGKQFNEIGSVDAVNTSGTHNYQFVDKDLSHYTVYYRLKMVDLDGTFKYSSVVAVKGLQTLDVEVCPIPTKNQISLDYPEVKKEGQAEIYNTVGQVKLSFKLPSGSTHLDQNLSNLKTGIYWLRLDIDGVKTTKKIIKE